MEGSDGVLTLSGPPKSVGPPQIMFLCRAAMWTVPHWTLQRAKTEAVMMSLPKGFSSSATPLLH
ncbi:hypothetical protein ACLOJK_003031 [Asimina triloba]